MRKRERTEKRERTRGREQSGSCQACDLQSIDKPFILRESNLPPLQTPSSSSSSLRSRRRLKDRIRIQFHSRRYSTSSPLPPACTDQEEISYFSSCNISARPPFWPFELRSITRVWLLFDHNVVTLLGPMKKKLRFFFFYQSFGPMDDVVSCVKRYEVVNRRETFPYERETEINVMANECR